MKSRDCGHTWCRQEAGGKCMRFEPCDLQTIARVEFTPVCGETRGQSYDECPRLIECLQDVQVIGK